MSHRIKRLYVCLAVLLLTLSAPCSRALAASEVNPFDRPPRGEHMTWSLDAGVLTIGGSGAMADYNNGDAPWQDSGEGVVRAVLLPGITSVGSGAFAGCGSLEEVTLPEGVESIGDWAFYGCGALTQVDLPESLTRVGESAFRDCAGLEEIILPANVAELGSGAFAGCTSLVRASLPEGLASIGDWAFYRCTSLEALRLPTGLERFGAFAFRDCTALTAFTVAGENPRYAAWDGALYNKELTSLAACPNGKRGALALPESVTEIQAGACSGCAFLTVLRLPRNLRTVGIGAFTDCAALTEASLPDSVTSLQGGAFEGCTSLRRARLPGGLDTVAGNLFQGCGALEAIELPDTVTAIGSAAFSGCTSLREVALPEGLKEIGPRAFFGCLSLRELSIPGGVRELGEAALANCVHLWRLQLGEGLERIGPEAFANCYVLSDLALPRSVRTVGDHAFQNCASLPGLTVPEGVDTLSWHLFEGCRKLEAVALPESLEHINYSTFSGCDALRRVLYAGTASQWEEIEIEEGNAPLQNAVFRYCAAPAAGFADVARSDGCAEAVIWAKETGVTTGKTASIFGPEDTVTRAQAITFLWRAMGRPEPEGGSVRPFTDVSPADYFDTAVRWAAEAGITEGTGGGRFSPELALTQAQVLTLLWRSEGSPQDSGDDLWYADAMRWAASIGLPAEDDPATPCPRADTVFYLWKVCGAEWNPSVFSSEEAS